MVGVELRTIYNISLAWMIQATWVTLGIRRERMNKLERIYLGHKIFQLLDGYACILKGKVKIIQVRLSTVTCNKMIKRKFNMKGGKLQQNDMIGQFSFIFNMVLCENNSSEFFLNELPKLS